MSYTPTTWATGDTITATKLNKIENGIAGAGGIGICTDVEDTLDKSYNDIISMISGGTMPILSRGDYYYAFNSLDYEDSYEVYFGQLRYYNADADEPLLLD